MAALALTSASTIVPSKILAEFTAPVAIVVAPEATMPTSPLMATSVATPAFPTRIWFVVSAPPIPDAFSVFPVKLSPVPRVISAVLAAEPVGLPNNLLAATS